MPISLDLREKLIQIKILGGPDWGQELAKVKDLPERKWNPKTKLWEVPWYGINEILERFQNVVFRSDELKNLSRSQDLTAWESLSPVSGSLDLNPAYILKPFQERYVRINPSKTKILLACEQGTGKCLMSLERAKLWGFKRLLIVGPKVVKENWKTEVRKVTGHEALIYHGTKKQRAKLQEELPRAGVVIATYETAAEVLAATEIPFDQLILDECHLFSSPKSKRFKEIQALAEFHRGKPIQALSGTPIQHKLQDLWAVFHILDPILAGTYRGFEQKFCHPTRFIIKKFIQKDKDGNPEKDDYGQPVIYERKIPTAWKTKDEEGLQTLLRSNCYRVTRQNITDFRDNVETITVELTDAQRRLYEAIRTQILIEIEERTLNLKDAPVRLLRLLQAAEGVFNFDSKKRDSGKLEYIQHELDNTDEKIIVWSRFKPITKILGELYKDRAVIYNGDQTDNYKTLAKWAFDGTTDRQDLEKYNQLLKTTKDFALAPGEAQFFFGTIDMRSSLGMNLHHDCHKQIFSSFSWLSTANLQAADRLRRIGQTAAEVYTQFLVAEDTFESKALNLVLSNYQNTLKVLDGADGLAFNQISTILRILKGME